MLTKQFWVVIFFCLFILSCSTVTKTPEFEYSIESMHAAIQKFMPSQKIAGRSQNGRTYFSEAFKLPRSFRSPGLVYVSGKDLPERAIARFTINGISRPYQIEVEVRVERLLDKSKHNGGKPGRLRYEYQGRQIEYEKFLATQISDYLVKRHENRNLIDDFRPF